MENLLTTSEVSEKLRVSTRTVLRLIASGELKGIKAGRQWRVSPDSLRAFIEGGGVCEGKTDGVEKVRGM